jgi:AraC family transcriptional regulator
LTFLTYNTWLVYRDYDRLNENDKNYQFAEKKLYNIFGNRYFLTMNENTVELMKGFPDFNVPGFDIEKYNQQFKEKNSVIWAKSKKIYYDRHWGGLSIKLALKGNEHYQTDHSLYCVNNSNFLILNKDTEYSSFIESESETESFTLNLNEKFTSSFITGIMTKPEDNLENNLSRHEIQMTFIEKIYKKDKLIFPVVSKIYKCLEDFNERNDEISEIFSDLLIALLTLNKKTIHEIENIKKIKPSTKEELYKRLYYAKDYIDTCYAEPGINLNVMAGIACLNREYFIRQFKLLFQVTPSQYVIGKRMKAARDILQCKEIPISEACRRTGYTNLTSFGKLFRRYYKMSPAEFKRSFT